MREKQRLVQGLGAWAYARQGGPHPLRAEGQGKRQLMAALRKKRRVVLEVKLTASPEAGGPSRAYTRKVSVNRPKRR
jgi:hypothetical protein